MGLALAIAPLAAAQDSQPAQLATPDQAQPAELRLEHSSELTPPSEVSQPADLTLSQSAEVGASSDLSQPVEQTHGDTLEQPKQLRWGRHRSLDGHYFPTPGFLPTAFSVSQVGIHSGLDLRQVPDFARVAVLAERRGQMVDLESLDMTNAIDVAVRLHEYIAVSAEVYRNTRVGLNSESLLNSAAAFTFGGRLGLLVKLLGNQHYRLAVSGTFGGFTGVGASIPTLIDDLARVAQDTASDVEAGISSGSQAARQIDRAFRASAKDILVTTSGAHYGGALNFAHALGRHFGLQSSAGLLRVSTAQDRERYDESSGRRQSIDLEAADLRLTLGLALDFDMSELGVPLDIMLEYNLTPVWSEVEVEQQNKTLDFDSIENLFALGLYYSGRVDFQFGVLMYARVGQPNEIGADSEPSGHPSNIGTRLVFRYFW